MLEKLKDFFYDCSDTLLSLFIILVMGLVITWKLSGAMSMPLFEVSNNSYDIINIEEPKNVEENVPQKDTDPEPTTENPSDSDNDVEVIQVEATNIKVEIPKGITGNGIAKILQQKGLIENPREFINRVEELGLGPKLRFGNFTIKSDSSIDKIISIITGTNNIN